MKVDTVISVPTPLDRWQDVEATPEAYARALD